MDFKTGKAVEIVKEFLAGGGDKFEINGVDLSKAVFMYRERNSSFTPIPRGNYATYIENNNFFLNVTGDVKTKAYEYQIVYTLDMKAGKYLEEYPELKVLVSKYNDLVEDVTNIIKCAKSTGVKVDTLKMTQILTPLEPNTFWSMNEDKKIVAFPLGNLNSKYEQMVSKLKKEVDELIKTTKETSLSEIEATAKNKIFEFTEELKNKINELNVIFDKTQEDIKSSVDKLNKNEKESIKEFERILEEKINSLNTLSDELKNSLSSVVTKYISDNKEILKGEQGEKGEKGEKGKTGPIGPQGERGLGITSIRSIGENKVEVTYGDNKKEILSIPTVQGPVGPKGEKGDGSDIDLTNIWSKDDLNELKGIFHNNVGIYIGANNEVNFTSSNDEIVFNCRASKSGSKITEFHFNAGESSSKADLYIGKLNASSKIISQDEIISGGDITAFSDIRLKSNIKKIDNALDKIMQISGYTYDMNSKRSTGVIAQEVEKILPEVVQDRDDGYKTVAYGNMIGLLVEAIKELKQEIEVLKNDNKV